MQRLYSISSAARAIVIVAMLAVAMLAGAAFAQTSVTRIVLVPFDATRSVEALGLATPGALQRALNQIDSVYVPPIGDALIVLQRATQAGVDPIAEIERLFLADAVVLGRFSGTTELEVELVVSLAGDDRTETIRGSTNDLTALWRTLAERIVALANVSASGTELAEMRGAIASAPETAVLGPLGTATARLPGVRLDDLETALALDDASPWLRSEAARVAALQGQLERAVTLASEAAAAAPNEVEIRAIEGVVKSAAGDTAGAEAAFRAALASNPAHAIALAGLGDLVAETSEQVALLERAIASSPRLVDAHLGLAVRQTTPQARLQALRRAAERLPDSVTTQRVLVETVLASGDARGALALLRQAVGDPVGASPALYSLASLFPASVGAEALDVVREGRERFPTSTALAIAEAELLVGSGEFDAAEDVLRQVVDENPDAVNVAEALSTVLARSGRIDEARAVLEGLTTRPDDLEIRLIELQLAAGRARVVLEQLEPRMAAGDGDLTVRTLYGVALGRVGRLDEAKRVLEEVVAEDAENEAALRALDVLEEQRLVTGDADLALEGDAAIAFEQGLYALEVGEYAAAAEAFARARSLQDAGLLAFYEGFARQNHGDVRGAITAYTAAREELADNDVLLNNLGFAQLQVGRIDLALDALQGAVAANPANAQAQLNLGLIHYQVGNFTDALTRFEEAVRLAPELEESVGPFVEEARRRSAQ
ncbi:MAG: tetratricopeptide repeat protein [Trueperaceae bacterium]|nr:tetratricopeptide repeat protein [Trueperaceae bacterium]